ncbi:MAG: hypothetical protein JSR77_05185 [Planctomycetes bacterium]|nr:hypothetical protein [Planctomycetota bacterium]
MNVMRSVGFGGRGVLPLVCVFAVSGAAAQSTIRYTVTNVGVGNQFCRTFSLNNSGVVAGVYNAGASQWRAYVWDPDRGVVFPQEFADAGFSSQSNCAINDAGAIVVSGAGLVGGTFVSRAAISDAGVVTVVPPVAGTYTDAAGINNSGHVTGRTDASPSQLHVYLYSGGGVTELGPVDPTFVNGLRPAAVNDSDDVVGVGDNSTGGISGFLWDGQMHNLGAFQPAFIDPAGRICGRMPVGLGFHAWLREASGVETDLGTLGGRSSAAAGMNNSGSLVGYSQVPDGSTAGFVTIAGVMVDLNDLLSRQAIADGWQITAAYAINSGGQILAFSGYYPLLLTPTGDCPADFTSDGGIDGLDVEAFFASWESGSPLADVNYDGGTDGEDVMRFYGVWAAGGC